MGYFRSYKSVIDEYDIPTPDQWNFDEKRFQMRMNNKD